MNLLAVFKRSPWVLAAATAAAAGMVSLSESAYRQSMGSLDAVALAGAGAAAGGAVLAERHQELLRALLIGRIGVALLSAVSLMALFMVLRQDQVLASQLLEQKRLVQAERDQLEIEVRERTAQLTELARHLQTAREDERQRLARDLHDELGGPGVGAVGMCLTGGFALAMMVDDHVVAPVLSQPSLPFPVGKHRKADLGISAEDLVRVKERVDDGICVLGLRFTGDPVVPAERFATLRRELGDGFVGVEIDSSKGNAHAIPTNAHSVLTEHLVDEPGHPTHDALNQVLDLFRERLLTE